MFKLKRIWKCVHFLCGVILCVAKYVLNWHTFPYYTGRMKGLPHLIVIPHIDHRAATHVRFTASWGRLHVQQTIRSGSPTVRIVTWNLFLFFSRIAVKQCLIIVKVVFYSTVVVTCSPNDLVCNSSSENFRYLNSFWIFELFVKEITMNKQWFG